MSQHDTVSDLGFTQQRRLPQVFDFLPFPRLSLSIFRSNLWLPGILTALAVVPLFAYSDNSAVYFRVIAYYIVAMAVVLFYQNSLTPKRLPAIIISGAIVSGILLVPQVWAAYIYVFRTLPGLVVPPVGPDFLEHFTFHFVAAGMLEELVKLTPALLLLIVTLVAAGGSSGWFAKRFAILTPMHGVMLGMAGGAIFTLIETLQLYVPLQQTRAVNDALLVMASRLDLSNLSQAEVEATIKVLSSIADQAGVASGLLLLLPRVLGALAGHMAWAAIFGYFIGLAGLYRGWWTVPLVLFGWVLASAMHASWNASAGVGSNLLLTIAAVVSSVFFVTYFLKARALITEGYQ